MSPKVPLQGVKKTTPQGAVKEKHRLIINSRDAANNSKTVMLNQQVV
jgi:hypothetical protein